MIVAASFHTFGYHELLIIDTQKLSTPLKAMFEAKKLGSHEKYSYDKNVISVEKYDYSSMLKEVNKAVIEMTFPLTIDKKLVVKEYDQMDGLMDSW